MPKEITYGYHKWNYAISKLKGTHRNYEAMLAMWPSMRRPSWPGRKASQRTSAPPELSPRGVKAVGRGVTREGPGC